RVLFRSGGGARPTGRRPAPERITRGVTVRRAVRAGAGATAGLRRRPRKGERPGRRPPSRGGGRRNGRRGGDRRRARRRSGVDDVGRPRTGGAAAAAAPAVP